MGDLSLIVECDFGAAPSACVALGEGWARVTLRGPPRVPAPGLFRRARAMLAAGAGAAATRGGPPRVGASGPDAPAGRALSDLLAECSRAWEAPEDSDRASDGAAGGNPAPERPPCGARSAAPSAAGATRLAPFCGAGSSEPAPLGRWVHRERALQPDARAGAEPGRERGTDTEHLRAMVGRVRQSIETHGAAPDFRLGRPGDKTKVYNYIRSTMAWQQAPDDFVEEVRLLLLGAPL